MSEILEPKVIKIDGGHWNEVGKVITTFQASRYPDLNFLEDKYSKSYRGVIRGMHGDNWTWKLMSCLYGQIFLQVIDARRNSPNYRKIWGYMLTPEDDKQILIPPGFINGHQVLKDDSILCYKYTSYYSGPKNQLTVHPMEYDWPLDSWSISDRDRCGVSLDEIDIENFRSGT